MYRYTTNDDKLIKDLKGYAKTFADKTPKDYSADKAITEGKFGGIWIEDRQEFAKFVSAVNTYPADVNGEGIAKTGNYLYLYYRGIDERIIPFDSVYLNKDESQDVANELINAWNNGEKERVREYINRAYEVSRNVNVQGGIFDGANKELSTSRENDRLGGKLSRLGRYYYTPELYSKVKRTDSGSTGQDEVRHSLITLKMDAPYLEAVERGDMATAERLVREAAAIAMPDTKVVDKDGLPKVVYHGTSSNDTFNVFDLEDSGMIFMTSSKGIADQYTQYYCHFLASAK